DERLVRAAGMHGERNGLRRRQRGPVSPNLAPAFPEPVHAISASAGQETYRVNDPGAYRMYGPGAYRMNRPGDESAAEFRTLIGHGTPRSPISDVRRTHVHPYGIPQGVDVIECLPGEDRPAEMPVGGG